MRWAGALVVGLAVTVVLTRGATAAQQPVHNGLIISPAIEQLTLAKGQRSVTFTPQVTNDSSQQLPIAVKVDDFTALNDSGTPLFLGNTDRAASPHGLAHWMAPTVTQFTLSPGATLAVPVTISDVGSLAPGGHYGAVIFEVLPAPASSQHNFIAANASVSLLVFLTTNTPGTQAIQLTKPAIDRLTWIIPASVDLLFTNTGDTQTTPHGTVTVVDSAGSMVAKGIVNTDSGQVLPATSRAYHIDLEPLARFVWPGTYHMRVSYHHDGQATYDTYEQTFVFVNVQIVIVAGSLLLIGVGSLLRRIGPARGYLIKRL